MPKFLDVTDKSAAKAALGFPETVTSVKTVAYTAAVGEFVRCDASAGGFTVTLPAAPVKGSVVVVRKIDTTNNTVIVQRSGTDVFNVSNGPTTLQLMTPGQSVTLRYDTGIWHVIAHSLTVVGLDGRYFLRSAGPVSTTEILQDSNGAPALAIEAAAGAQSYLVARNSAAAEATLFVGNPAQNNVNLVLRAKNSGFVTTQSNNKTTAVFSGPSDAVNYFRFSSSAGGNRLPIQAEGSDTHINIDLIPKGSNGIATVKGTEIELTSRKGVANGYASLDANGRLPVAQLPVSAMEYKGVYDASTNTPSLSNGTGDAGDMYRVTVSGTRNFGAGAISLEAGDYVIYSGTEYQRVDAVDAVTSVAGKTGVVTLAAADLTDSTTTGRALITTTDSSTARTTLGVAYGTTAGTVAQGNDSRITGAEQSSNKNAANGYAGLNASSQLTANTTGNAATATKLATARTISGVSFDGSADITVNNGVWLPTDLGYKAWAFDPVLVDLGGYNEPGWLYVTGVRIPHAMTITNLHLWVGVAGTSLTADQCFAGLYQGGNKLGETASQHTEWASTGHKTMALTSTANVSAGLAYVAFYFRGTGTLVQFGQARITTGYFGGNGALSSDFRFAYANTGLTTALPATLGTRTAIANKFWAAVS